MILTGDTMTRPIIFSGPGGRGGGGGGGLHKRLRPHVEQHPRRQRVGQEPVGVGGGVSQLGGDTSVKEKTLLVNGIVVLNGASFWRVDNAGDPTRVGIDMMRKPSMLLLVEDFPTQEEVERIVSLANEPDTLWEVRLDSPKDDAEGGGA